MKKIFISLIFLVSLITYGATTSTIISGELEKMNKAEDLRMEKLIKRKKKLENELSLLQSNYNSRVEIVEKLKVDSEVRWNRDEYREVLKKYDVVQLDLERKIIIKEKELKQIEKVLEISDLSEY